MAVDGTKLCGNNNILFNVRYLDMFGQVDDTSMACGHRASEKALAVYSLQIDQNSRVFGVMINQVS